MASTTTMRVAVSDRDAASELAREQGRSQMEIVHEAIELYRRQHMLAAMNAGFAALRGDAAAWHDELVERNAWDVVLTDVSKNE